MKAHKILINGKWVNSISGERFKSLNPATGQSIGEFQSGDRNDINLAVDAAEHAFEEWSSIPAPKRGEMLLHAAALLRQEKESLARLVSTEMGKVIKEARGDVQEAIDIAEYMAGEGRRLFGHTTPSEMKDKFCMTVRRPVGICGLITPWNFPTAIPAWKIMPALICGNTVVLKPASDTPMCAIRFLEIIQKAGFPAGVINLVTGSGEQAGMPLVRHKSVGCISFTGSRDTGLQISKEAGIKKIGLELGGKNGIIVLEDADLSLALDGVIWGGFGTTGQRCTAASRVIVQQSVKEKFERALAERTSKLRLGSGLDLKTDVGPLINKAAVEKVHMYTEIGLKEGAKLLCGGSPLKGKGFFYKPTIFTNVTYDMRIAQEEIFGPTVCIIPVKDLAEATEVSNSVSYGLSSSIYTSSIRSAFKAIEGIHAGITYVNSSTIGAEVHLPFGGVKQTGSTREAGIEGINEFSEIKTVYFDYSGRLQKAQIDR
jgi:acyl-CoA reductase-like NAD-dependent aldehyde dehydrogenase